MSRGAGAIRLPILLAVIPIPSIDFPVPLRTHAGRATTASQVVLSERNRLLELLLWPAELKRRFRIALFQGALAIMLRRKTAAGLFAQVL
jgi:hypothetical protein